MKNFLSLLICCLALTSCKEKSIKWSIADDIEKKCPNSDTCLFDFNSVMNFKWDKLYLFSSGTSLEETDSILGFHYPYFEDIADRIIFVNNNQVVYHEDEFPNPEKEPIAHLIFNLGDKHMYVCTPKTAKFGVKCARGGDYNSYVLSPVKLDK